MTFGTGTLLGLDFDGTMEVSNCFPLPAFADEDDKAAKTAAQGIYTSCALRKAVPDNHL